MKDYLLNGAKAFLLAAAVFIASCLPEGALAQTVSKQPQFIQNQQFVDLGNGPAEVLALEGTGRVYSALGSGVGSTSGASTTLTLTATPAVPPCVGCVLSGAGITAGTTVSAFNGTTTITMSAAMTVPASSAISWGAACPSSLPAPGSTNPLSVPVPVRAGAGAGDTAFPFYTYARLCGFGDTQNGYTLMTFPIGAW